MVTQECKSKHMNTIDNMVHSGGECLYICGSSWCCWTTRRQQLFLSTFWPLHNVQQFCHMVPNIQQPLFVCSYEGEKLEKFCAANKFDEKSGSDLIDQMHLSRQHFSLSFLNFSLLFLFYTFFGDADKCQDWQTFIDIVKSCVKVNISEAHYQTRSIGP